MKFCQKCGKELNDDAIVCIGCGCAVTPSPTQSNTSANTLPTPGTSTGGAMGIASIVVGAVGIPFAWLIALLGYIFGGAGLVLAIFAMKNDPFSSKGKIGLILSIITLVSSVINSILGVIIMMGLMV